MIGIVLCLIGAWVIMIIMQELFKKGDDRW